MLEDEETVLALGLTVNYYGGQLALLVRPFLPAANPGLQIEMEGRSSEGDVVGRTFYRKPFGRTCGI